MKHALQLLAVVAALAVLNPAAGAQTAAQKTMITGTTPFTLGMATGDALAADSTLAVVQAAICGTPAHGASYGSRVTAPIAGYPFVANLVLCFADGRLGAIYLTWPQGTFHEETVRWQLATRALAQQLSQSYAPALVRRYTLNDNMGGIVELADAQGNLVTMTSDPGDDPDIRVAYVSASYDQAVNGKRVTLTNY